MSTPDPTPTPAAPDWRALCRELKDLCVFLLERDDMRPFELDENELIARADAALATPPGAPCTTREQVKAAVADALGSDAYDCLRVWSAWSCGTMGPDDFSAIAEDDDRVAEIADAAIAALATTPPAPPLEPRGCPTPGACSCPTTPIVPPELIRALELAEAALADIGNADDEPTDDFAWFQRRGLWAQMRAAQPLPRIRHALQAWRDHATPLAPTREAADMSRESILEWLRNDPAWGVIIAPKRWRTEDDDLLELIQRAVAWARAQATRPAIDCEALEERFEQWWHNEGSTPPSEGRDWEEHVHYMTRIAWHNGARPATQKSEIDEESAPLISWLLEMANAAADADVSDTAGRLTLAAQLLGERRPAIQPVPQLPPEQEFALRLYQLLERFDAELFYTNNDDGVHFSVGTSKPFSGFCGLSELRDQLIEAGLLPAADQQEGRDDG